MARVQADDYGEKREAILDTAAKQFARDGYATCKMTDIAARCGTSKSMLYHYFEKKEDVLAAIIQGYGAFIMSRLDEVQRSGAPPEEKLTTFVERFIDKPAPMKPRHVIFLREARFLPARERKAVDDISRRVLRQLGDMIGELGGSSVRQPDRVALHARLLFGSLNAIDSWYRRGGALSPRALSEEIVRQLLFGLRAGSPAPAREPVTSDADDTRPPRRRRARALASGA